VGHCEYRRRPHELPISHIQYRRHRRSPGARPAVHDVSEIVGGVGMISQDSHLLGQHGDAHVSDAGTSCITFLSARSGDRPDSGKRPVGQRVLNSHRPSGRSAAGAGSVVRASDRSNSKTPVAGSGPRRPGPAAGVFAVPDANVSADTRNRKSARGDRFCLCFAPIRVKSEMLSKFSRSKGQRRCGRLPYLCRRTPASSARFATAPLMILRIRASTAIH
jgi:hypothetical protein